MTLEMPAKKEETDEIVPENFGSICRACLMADSLESVFDVSFNEIALSEIYLQSTSVKICENEPLPTNVCLPCINKLINAYIFIKQCKDMDNRLRGILDRRDRMLNLELDLQYVHGIDINTTPSENFEVDYPELSLKTEDIKTDVKLSIPHKSGTHPDLPDNHEVGDDNGNDSDIGEVIVKPEKPKRKVKWENKTKKGTLTIKKENIVIKTPTKMPTKIKKKPGPKIEGVKRVRKKRATVIGPGPPFACVTCLQQFKTRSELKLHYKENKFCIPHIYKCGECNKCFKVKYQLELHITIHTNVLPYSCKVCKKKFRLPQNLARHKKVHTGEKPYMCAICGRVFTRALTRDEHVRSHTGEKPYVCSYCGKQFRAYTPHHLHVIRHKINNGAKYDKFQVECKTCNKVFFTKGQLKIHEQRHTGEKLFLCPVCGKEFVTNGALKSHSKTHTGIRPYPCLTCNKSFSHKAGLQKHTNIHTGVKPYSCKICQQSFSQDTHLKFHMRVHSGERPYKCEYCPKTFAQNSNLTVHTRIHTGEKPYVCTVCTKGYHDSSSLKRHKAKIHKDFIDCKDIIVLD